MPVLKYWTGSAWVEVGGTGPGVPAGGSAGQVLTKTSATDYATAWGTNQPILANNTALQGYKADGTTAQALIQTTAADDISIGSGLAAGKAISLGGTLNAARVNVGGELWVTLAGDFTSSVRMRADLWVDGVIYKTSGSAYVNPDYVFEHAHTGTIQQFAAAPGAAEYTGLPSLTDLEAYTREHWRLPHHVREDDRVDIVRRTHDTLAEVERLVLYLFDHEKRLKALETR